MGLLAGLNAIVAGETNPIVMAALAKGNYAANGINSRHWTGECDLINALFWQPTR